MKKILLCTILILIVYLPAYGTDLPQEMRDELGSYILVSHANPILKADAEGNLHLFYMGEFIDYADMGRMIGSGVDLYYSKYSPPKYERIIHYDKFNAAFWYGTNMLVSDAGYAYCTYGHDEYYLSVFHDSKLKYKKDLGILPRVEHSFLLNDNSLILPGYKSPHLGKDSMSFTQFTAKGKEKHVKSIQRLNDQLEQLPFMIWYIQTIHNLEDNLIYYFGYSGPYHPDSINNNTVRQYRRVGMIVYDFSKERIVKYKEYELSKITGLTRFNTDMGELTAVPVPGDKIYIFCKIREGDHKIESCVFAIDHDLNLNPDDTVHINELNKDVPFNDSRIDGQFFVFKSYSRNPEYHSGAFTRYIIMNDEIYYSKLPPIVCEACKEYDAQREKFIKSMESNK